MALTKDQVLRAWEDEEFRNSLPEADRRMLPPRPAQDAGTSLTDEQLDTAVGGSGEAA